MTERPRLTLVVSNDAPRDLPIAVRRAMEGCTCGGAQHHYTCRYWELLPKYRRPEGINHVRVLAGFPACT